MVTAVGGSGVFSGPTGAQYQQAGVEGLSGALAQQRAFAEQKRAQEFQEIYNLAKANADTLQVPITSVMSDPGFQDVVRSKLGNSMGGFLGIGGQRRLDQFLSGLVQTYGGQAGEEYRSKGDVATGRIVADTGQDVQTSFDQAGYNAGLQGLLNPPAPAGVTPPPAPGTTPPASTPAPASTSAVDKPVGDAGYTVGVQGIPKTSPGNPLAAIPEGFQRGKGVKGSRTMRDTIDNATALSMLSSGEREEYGKNLNQFLSAEFTPEQLYAMAQSYAQPKDPKTGIPLRTGGNFRLAKAAMDAADIKSGGEVSAQAAPFLSEQQKADLLRSRQAATGAASAGTPPEAAGQSAGVGAAQPTKGGMTLEQARAKLKEANKGNEGVIRRLDQAKSFEDLQAVAPNGYKAYIDPSAGNQAAAGSAGTQAAATQAAPVGLEIPQKLGWSSDDLALFRRFQGVSQEELGSDPGLRRDYARFRQMNQQLKDLYTTETRKEIRGFKAAPGYEKDAAVQRSLKYLELTSPDNPLLNDPRFAAFKTDVTNQNIRQKEAMIRNELAQAGYTEAKIKTVVDDTEAALLMSQAEVLKARNEGLKAAYDGLDGVLSGLNDQFAKAMMEAKGNKAKEEEALAAYNNALANNPVLKTFWDSNVKLLAESNGMTIQMQNFMTQRAKFLQSGKSSKIPTASAFAAPGTAEDQTAAALISEATW